MIGGVNSRDRSIYRISGYRDGAKGTGHKEQLGVPLRTYEQLQVPTVQADEKVR
jgi:hypothetical protein